MILTPTNKARLDLTKCEIERQGGIQLEIISESMAPTIQIQDMVVVQNSTPKLFDIVAIFMVSGDILVHRYWGQRLDQIVTRGDQCSDYEYTPPEHYLGVVKTIYRNHLLIPIKGPCKKPLWVIQYFANKIRSLSAPPLRNIIKNIRLHQLETSPYVSSITSTKNNRFDIILFDCFSSRILELERAALRQIPYLRFCTESIYNSAYSTKEMTLSCAELYRQLIGDTNDHSLHYKFYYQAKRVLHILHDQNCLSEDDITIHVSQKKILVIKALRELLLTPHSASRTRSINELASNIVDALGPLNPSTVDL